MARVGARRSLRAWAIVLAVALAIGGYTVWDDGRFVVSTVTIAHPQLPAAFDGYRIVQVSDLHGARFGAGQADLLAAIAAARPDLILLTGDYTDALERSESADLAPVTELVGGLPAGVPVYYVLGNWDARGAYGAGPVIETRLVRALESKGARPVYPYAEITRSGQRIWLTDWTRREFKNEAAMRSSLAAYLATNEATPARATALYEAWWARQQAGYAPASEFDIAVTHRPLDFPDYDAELARSAREESAATSLGAVEFFTEVDYDVNIAGHEHGGQFRLPFVGPLVSADGVWFPAEASVEGTRTDASGRIGYISRGLGAGGPVPLLRFRLFDTPELSVIVLRRGAATP